MKREFKFKRKAHEKPCTQSTISCGYYGVCEGVYCKGLSLCIGSHCEWVGRRRFLIHRTGIASGRERGGVAHFPVLRWTVPLTLGTPEGRHPHDGTASPCRNPTNNPATWETTKQLPCAPTAGMATLAVVRWESHCSVTKHTSVSDYTFKGQGHPVRTALLICDENELSID